MTTASASAAASASTTLAVARRAVFRPVLGLLIAFLTLSAAMIAFLAVVTAVGGDIGIALWIRSSFVLASAVVLLLFGVSAARGSRGAWVRLRIVSPVVVAAVIVIVAIPGLLPDWARVEQAVCGALVLAVAILVNLPRARAVFARAA